MFNHSAIKHISTNPEYRAVLILLAAVSSVINVYIIIKYIVKVHSTKKFPNYLTCCVALSDLFIVLLAALLLAVSYTSQSQISNTLWMLQYVLFDYSFTMYLCTILLCVIDRYLCIAKPLFYRTLSSKGWTKGIVVAVWLVSCVPPLCHLSVCGFKYEKMLSETDEVFRVCFKGLLLLLSLVVVLMLIVTCVMIKRHLVNQQSRHRRRAAQQSSVSSQGHQDNLNPRCNLTKKRKSRVTKASICMTIAFMITFIPTTITSLCHNLGLLRDMDDSDLRVLVDTTTLLYLCTSFIDPCITLVLKKEFRHPGVDLRTLFTLSRSLEGAHTVGTVFVNKIEPSVSKITLVGALSDSSIP